MTTMQITRRTMLAGMAGAFMPPLMAASAAKPAARVRHSYGCCLINNEIDMYLEANEPLITYFSGNEPIIKRSGDPHLDFAIAQSLFRIGKVFGVVPGFGYFDDYDGRNAYATEVVRLNSADGTVVFGLRLLQELIGRTDIDSPEVGIAAVCAHEFGHIYQYRTRLFQALNEGQDTIKLVELHADFLAGYFAGIRKSERSDFPAALFAITQRRYGDYNVGSRNHHGTPEERGNAVVAGFDAARRGLDMRTAAQAGVRYVRSV